jgi:hypothetical protein
MTNGQATPFSKTFVMTGTQLGTSAFIPTVRIQPSTNGSVTSNVSGACGTILIVDIGPA